MAGVLGCFAFGVGSTDMASAWYTKDIRIRVPETVRYVLQGKKRADVAAKDVMLVVSDGGWNAPHNPDFIGRPRFGNYYCRTRPRNHQCALSILLAGEEFSGLEEFQLRKLDAVPGHGLG